MHLPRQCVTLYAPQASISCYNFCRIPYKYVLPFRYPPCFAVFGKSLGSRIFKLIPRAFSAFRPRISPGSSPFQNSGANVNGGSINQSIKSFKSNMQPSCAVFSLLTMRSHHLSTVVRCYALSSRL